MIQKGFALLLATGAFSLARADDAFSNLSPNPGAYNAGSSWFINPTQTQGFQFTTTATGILTGLQIAMNNVSTADGRAAFSVGLYANSGTDTLGTLLGTYSGASTGANYQTATSALASVAVGGSPVTITAGSKYWLVASSGNFLAWNTSLSGRARHYQAGSGYYFDGSTSSAFSVQVNPVPEPVTSLALGLGAMALIRNRRKR